MTRFILFASTVLLFNSCFSQKGETYAERLGYPSGKKIIILHIDDAGMSFDSNEGAYDALTNGVSNSVSVMMPCPWVPDFLGRIKDKPNLDVGMHVTLNSEWDTYRWGPIAGKDAVPSLVDEQGYFWPSTGQSAQNGNPADVATEINAQLAKARAMGLNPTHIDAHMGTIFSREDFITEYVKLGMMNHIPVMFPCGHNTYFKNFLREQMKFKLMAQGKYTEGMELPLPMSDAQGAEMGERLWGAGLPAIDDLHNQSYDWVFPEGMEMTDANIMEFRREKYKEIVNGCKPGITMIIMHCTNPTEAFHSISEESFYVRKGDYLVMKDPNFKKFLEDEGIIFTTWKELGVRRNKLGK
ncbi:MAG: polysaccharide deacetylase family protein [Salibacteraceae bacterium]